MQIAYLIILGIAHGQQRQALQQKRLYFSSEIKTFKNTLFSFCWEMHVPKARYLSSIGGYKTKCGRLCRDL